MKLRIAHKSHPNRLAGVYVVQRRQVGISREGLWMWTDMWYNKHNKRLELEAVLGQGMIVKAEFETFEEAEHAAKSYLTYGQSEILETWEVSGD